MLTEHAQTEELPSDSKYATADLFVEDRPIEGFRRIILCRPTRLPGVADLQGLIASLGLTVVNPEIDNGCYELKSMDERPEAAEPLLGQAVVPGLLVVDQPWATTEAVAQAAREMQVQLAGVEQMLVLAHRHNLLGYSSLVVAGNGRFYLPGGAATGLANLWSDVSRATSAKPVQKGGLGVLPIVQEWRRDTVFPFVS